MIPFDKPTIIREDGKLTISVSAMTDADLFEAISYLAKKAKGLQRQSRLLNTSNRYQQSTIDFRLDRLIENSFPLIKEIRQRNLPSVKAPAGGKGK